MPIMLPDSVRVLMPTGFVEEMKIETYLAGAVAAEIGATAPLEALKAQAVASRTYVVSTQRHQEHGADVCTTSHCQKWKRIDPVTAPEVFRAVSETWGMVLTHHDKLINAFFFEHCDGHTRNSEEMLMPALPYLRGVDCACGFLAMRGHGVGMCKRGAIVMARRGAAFDRILQHYYQGVTIVQTARAESEESASTPDMLAVVPAGARSRMRRKKEESRVEPKPVTPSHAPASAPEMRKPAHATPLLPETRSAARPTPAVAPERSEPVAPLRVRRRAPESLPPESMLPAEPPPERITRKSSDSSVTRKNVAPPSEPGALKSSDSGVTRKKIAPPSESAAPKSSDSGVTRKKITPSQVTAPKPSDSSVTRKKIEPPSETVAQKLADSVARRKSPITPAPKPADSSDTRAPIQPPVAPIASEPVAPLEPTQEPRVPLILPTPPVAPIASEPVAPIEPT
ncbi:MAG: SpoIID/LytB domain-containing protein, partial [Chloroflexi bacterium]|nr:SpoIID/LytB domain-containing protein [Chloroflexota bacterium]